MSDQPKYLKESQKREKDSLNLDNHRHDVLINVLSCMCRTMN